MEDILCQVLLSLDLVIYIHNGEWSFLVSIKSCNIWYDRLDTFWIEKEGIK